ncbi:DDE-type integrase/transposase/recombinase [Brevundimonas sp.]|uniref:DDE-type integrase/transposase/recombinase n=1 Tax=Brevundimonas sp. TaxID=1871086 RepID=UPI002FCCAAC4
MKWSARSVAGVCISRAVDDEGEVLDIIVQRRWDAEAALQLLRRLLLEPESITTDGLASYSAALVQLELRRLISRPHFVAFAAMRIPLGWPLPSDGALGRADVFAQPS